MHSVSLLSPAKINLYLEIVGNRPDGYHELVMLMQAIELSDLLEFRLNGTEEIRLFSEHPHIPTDQSNLIYRAANLLKKEFPEAFNNYGGVDITLDKFIPIAAGLAGGSSNAAATLVGLNLLWRLGLTQTQIQELSAQLGSDIPFCVTGGTALATGRGEKIDSLPSIEDLWLVLAKYESLEVSTAWAYQTYRQQFSHTYPIDTHNRGNQTHSVPIIRAIVDKDTAQIGRLLHNDLEKVVLPAYPQVELLRQTLQKAGGLGTMMSGSGPTVFTLCKSLEAAQAIQEQAQTKLNNGDLKFWITRFVTHGVKIVKLS